MSSLSQYFWVQQLVRKGKWNNLPFLIHAVNFALDRTSSNAVLPSDPFRGLFSGDERICKPVQGKQHHRKATAAPGGRRLERHGHCLQGAHHSPEGTSEREDSWSMILTEPHPVADPVSGAEDTPTNARALAVLKYLHAS